MSPLVPSEQPESYISSSSSIPSSTSNSAQTALDALLQVQVTIHPVAGIDLSSYTLDALRDLKEKSQEMLQWMTNQETDHADTILRTYADRWNKIKEMYNDSLTRVLHYLRTNASDTRASDTRATSTTRETKERVLPALPTEIVEACNKSEEWIHGPSLGAGMYGAVFIACAPATTSHNPISKSAAAAAQEETQSFEEAAAAKEIETKNCKYVIKIQDLGSDKSFENEVAMLRKLNTIVPPLAPRMYDYWTCEDEGFIVMDRLQADIEDMTLDDEDRDSIKELVATLHRQRLTHGDLKPDNIMYRDNPETGKRQFFLVDFGFGGDYSNLDDAATLGRLTGTRPLTFRRAKSRDLQRLRKDVLQ